MTNGRTRHARRATRAAVLVSLALALAACEVLGLGVGMAPGPAGALYRCATFAFDPMALERPGTAERDDGPIAATLREHLATGGEPGLLPDTGWHLAGSDAVQAEFVAKSNDGYASVRLERADAGWMVSGWGGCDPALVMAGGARAATWQLADEAAVNGASTTITVLVAERSCASGKAPDGRVVGPRVVMEPRVVRIAFGVIPLPGDQECPGSPPARVVVDLGEPIGGRVLSDFGIWPPVNVWAE